MRLRINKILALPAVFFILLLSLQNLAQAAVIHIQTLQQLQNINSNLGGSYVLDNDITPAPDTPFTSIGDDTHQFTGTFDGNNHTISNLTINGRGFFTHIGASATVQNLRLKNINVYTTLSFSGNFAGICDGTLTNILDTMGTLTVGGTEPHRTIIGGLIGENTGPVSKCYADIAIRIAATSSMIGGFVGRCYSNTISESASTGNISTTSLTVSVDFVGGFAGQLYLGNTVNCYTHSSITSNYGSNIGGFEGLHRWWGTGQPNAYHCYASGTINVTYPSGIGGFTGYLQNYPTSISLYTDNYWDTDTTGTTQAIGNVGGAVANINGRTTTLMQQRATFSAWDINASNPSAIWDIVENQTYPYFKQQQIVVTGNVLDPNGGVPTSAIVHLAINGSPLADSVTTGLINNNFAFVLYPSELTNDNAFLFYLDSSGTPGNLIYFPNNDTANVTGLKIYFNRVVLSSNGNFNDGALLKKAVGDLTDGILLQINPDGSFLVLAAKLDVNVNGYLALNGHIAGAHSAIDTAQRVYVINAPIYPGMQYINAIDLYRYHAGSP